MWSFPASFLAAFFDNHGVLQIRNRPRWRTIPGGSKRYVEALIAPFADRIRLSHAGPADRARRRRRRRSMLDDGAERFDEVVIATHSDQALRDARPTPTPLEREILGAIPYQHNEAVLHTDTSADAAPPRRLGELELPPARRAAGAIDASPTT